MLGEKIPVIGGVKDGATHPVPTGALTGYTAVLKAESSGPDEEPKTTEYVLREHPHNKPERALVAKGMMWPIIAAAGV
jgi:hypothetical protein